jgi:hypothetical protein
MDTPHNRETTDAGRREQKAAPDEPLKAFLTHPQTRFTCPSCRRQVCTITAVRRTIVEMPPPGDDNWDEFIDSMIDSQVIPDGISANETVHALDGDRLRLSCPEPSCEWSGVFLSDEIWTTVVSAGLAAAKKTTSRQLSDMVPQTISLDDVPQAPGCRRSGHARRP